MIKYTLIAILCYLPLCSDLTAQSDLINIRSVNISGNESIKKRELMPMLRQRPSNFSFTFKGTTFNKRLLKMDALTLKNFFILLEESQNATVEKMKMFLTRFCFGSKVVITGDITQIDLPKNTLSGLVHSLEVLRSVEDIGLVEFDTKDVVRHGLVQKIVEAYAKFSN